jgi:hypothetical protein
MAGAGVVIGGMLALLNPFPQAGFARDL